MSRTTQRAINRMNDRRWLERKQEAQQLKLRHVTPDMILYVPRPLNCFVGVAQQCGVALNRGHWFCVTHSHMFDKLIVETHESDFWHPHTIDDEHLLLWYCEDHGKLEIAVDDVTAANCASKEQLLPFLSLEQSNRTPD